MEYGTRSNEQKEVWHWQCMDGAFAKTGRFREKKEVQFTSSTTVIAPRSIRSTMVYDRHLSVPGPLPCEPSNEMSPTTTKSALYQYTNAATAMQQKDNSKGTKCSTAAMPNGAMPNDQMPHAQISNTAMPNAAMPNAAIPNAAMPNAAIPNPKCQTLQCQMLQCQMPNAQIPNPLPMPYPSVLQSVTFSADVNSTLGTPYELVTLANSVVGRNSTWGRSLRAMTVLVSSSQSTVPEYLPVHNKMGKAEPSETQHTFKCKQLVNL